MLAGQIVARFCIIWWILGSKTVLMLKILVHSRHLGGHIGVFGVSMKGILGDFSLLGQRKYRETAFGEALSVIASFF